MTPPREDRPALTPLASLVLHDPDRKDEENKLTDEEDDPTGDEETEAVLAVYSVAGEGRVGATVPRLVVEIHHRDDEQEEVKRAEGPGELEEREEGPGEVKEETTVMREG